MTQMPDLTELRQQAAMMASSMLSGSDPSPQRFVALAWTIALFIQGVDQVAQPVEAPGGNVSPLRPV